MKRRFSWVENAGLVKTGEVKRHLYEGERRIFFIYTLFYRGITKGLARIRGSMNKEHEFEELALKFEPLIKKSIRFYGLQKDYQEAYQIGLLALWEAWESFDPIKGFFPAYAKAMVQGRLKSYLKKEVNYRLRFETVENQIEDTQELPLVLPEIDFEAYKLSERELLWIHETFEKGRTTQEMAYHFQVSENTVRSWKKGVKQKMKKIAKTGVFLTYK